MQHLHCSVTVLCMHGGVDTGDYKVKGRMYSFYNSLRSVWSTL